jgi:hypothetical protein
VPLFVISRLGPSRHKPKANLRHENTKTKTIKDLFDVIFMVADEHSLADAMVTSRPNLVLVDLSLYLVAKGGTFALGAELQALQTPSHSDCFNNGAQCAVKRCGMCKKVFCEQRTRVPDRRPSTAFFLSLYILGVQTHNSLPLEN